MKTDQKPPENSSLVPIARERHQAALLRYATRMLGNEAVQASELVEGTFAELKLQPVEDVEDELAEWLFADCRKRAFEVLQREGRLKRFEAGDAEKNAAAGPAAGDMAEAEEAHVTMQRLLDRLTPKQQEAMWLKFQDGFGQKEIARITELSPMNVGILVHNAVARLGREFRAQRPDGGESRLGNSDDPRLTLYALGEMEDAERKSFERSLFDKKAAGARVDEIRATCSLIGKTLAIEAGAPAPRTVRRKKAKRWRGLSLWLRFPRVLVLLAGVAAVAGLGRFLMQRKTEAAATVTAVPAVDFRLKAAPWEEQPALAGSATKPDLVSGGGVDSAGNLAGLRPRERISSPLRTAGAQATTRPVSLETAAADGGSPTGDGPMGVTAVARGQRGAVKPENGPPGPDETERAAAADRENSTKEPEVGELSARAKPADAPAPGNENHPVRRTVAAATGAKAAPEKRKFESPKETPVSPLPVDTGTASVADLKRSLRSGRWPPPGAVRVEEMLNYFPFNYAAPAAPADFAPAMETAEAPWAPSHRLVRIGLKGREAPPPARAAANLVLLIDISGSMVAPNRLPLVKEAARLLLGRLRPDDHVGIVTYAGESRLTLLPTAVAEARKILEALGRLEAGGLTNGGAGLELAYDLAKAHAAPDGVNCVILCTDGDFNVGPTSEADLTRLIDRQAKSAVKLSIFGFGRNGRIDPRLEALAAHGRGGSGYVNTRREAEQVLTAQLNGLFEPLAQDVKVEVAFNPASVQSYRLLGYEDRDGALQDGGAGALQAGAVLPGHTLTALYEVVTAEGAASEADLLKLRVSYKTPHATARRQLEFSLRDRPATFGEASLEFKFAAAVAAFGMVLRDSPEKGAVTLEKVEAWGRECLGDDAGGYRSEFLSLVEQAKAARP